MSDFTDFNEWYAEFNKRGFTHIFSRKKSRQKKLTEKLADNYTVLTDFMNSDLNEAHKLEKLACIKPYLGDFANSLDTHAGKFAKSIKPSTKILADLLDEDAELFFSGLDKNAGKFFLGLESEVLTLTSELGPNLEFMMKGLKENSRLLAYTLNDYTFDFAKIIAENPEPFINGSGKCLFNFTRGLEHRARDFGRGISLNMHKFANELKNNAKALTRGFAQYNFDFALGIQLEVKQLVLGLGPHLVNFSAGLGDYAHLFKEGLGPYLSTFMITQDDMQDYFLGTNIGQFRDDAAHISFGKTHRILPRCYLCRSTIEKSKKANYKTTCPECNSVYHRKCANKLKQCKMKACNDSLK